VRKGAGWVRALPTAIPGIFLFGVLWLIIIFQIDYASTATNVINGMWQSLGVAYLSADPLGSLSVLHIQPWGLNALYTVDLWLTPDSHLLLLMLYFLAGVGSIGLLCASLVRLRLPRVWALWSGVLLGLLPGTVLYSFWPYSVTLSAFLGTVVAWGLAVTRTRPGVGAFVSAVGILGLQFMRTTFIWVVVLAWCVFLLVLLFRRIPSRRFLVAALPVLGVVAVSLLSQGYYWANYQLPAMSSWSGQNIAKALLQSGKLNVTVNARSEIERDPCLSSLLNAYETQALSVWDPGGLFQLPGCEGLAVAEQNGILAWDEDFRDSGDMNFNSRVALSASSEWTRMMSIIVRNDPLQLARMVLTTNSGPRNSGIGLYLDPSEEYSFIDAQRTVLPLGWLTGLLSIVFAPAMFVLILIGVGRTVLVRRSFLRRGVEYWAILALVGFHAAASTLAEYGENMRFRAEIDPLLLLLGVLSLFALVQGKAVLVDRENVKVSTGE